MEIEKLKELEKNLTESDYKKLDLVVQIETLKLDIQQQVQKLVNNLPDIHKIHDGYHTFEELYNFRMLFNAHLFNEWHKLRKHQVHKSLRHFDGELCFDGEYFIVCATLPTGQISNHYEIKYWNFFNIEETKKALNKWDGHTSLDVANRLREYLLIGDKN